mgnify:CR=1 FL=1
MSTQDHLEALQDIRQMMNKSARFLTLSGLSGMLAGIYALIAAALAYVKMEERLPYLIYSKEDNDYFLIVAIGTLIVSVLTSFVLTKRKAQKQGVSVWDETAKTAMINLAIPLLAGGAFCVAMLYHNLIGLLAPVALIFYGLALVNVSKHTFTQVRQLGLIQLSLGIINLFFIGYGLIFWTLGFGLAHIVYGFFMYRKYDVK